MPSTVLAEFAQEDKPGALVQPFVSSRTMFYLLEVQKNIAMAFDIS